MTQDDDGWTTVPVRKSKFQKKSKFKPKKNHSQSFAIQKALRNESSSWNHSSIPVDLSNPSPDAIQHASEIHMQIQSCMKAMEQEPNGFYNVFCQHLKTILHLPADDTTTSSHPCFHFEYDIVCYGIGNFEMANSAPMLQLSCVLLLQKHLSLYTEFPIMVNYYEPVMTPMEHLVFQTHYTDSISILTINERGKRIISKPTLFYMPHCPLRLYNNVIWANWENILSTSTTIQNDSIPKILFFGNSFYAYQDRSIQTNNDIDPTNGMRLLIDYCIEQSCYINTNKKKQRYSNHDDRLWNMEKAFNDSALIYFHFLKKEEVEFPNRPSEYIGALVPDTSKSNIGKEHSIVLSDFGAIGDEII